MEIRLRIGERNYQVDIEAAVSLARPLDFAAQVTEFSAPPPQRQRLQVGEFIGDTRRGGGCNVDQLSLIPHCHGTHTETVGHIVDQPVTIADAHVPAWLICLVLTVTPELGGKTDEAYQPPPVDNDLLITMAALKASLHNLHLLPMNAPSVEALVVRCQTSAPAELPPYFSTDAILWCHQCGIQHLLVESPSIDRVEDGGLLTNHHAYWNIPAQTHALTADSWTQKTITESISIPAGVQDGVYLLNLQVPRFVSDAAPSQPTIWPLQAVDEATEGPR